MASIIACHLCLGGFSTGTLFPFIFYKLLNDKVHEENLNNKKQICLNVMMALYYIGQTDLDEVCREWLMELYYNTNEFSSMCNFERVLLSAICKKAFSVC